MKGLGAVIIVGHCVPAVCVGGVSTIVRCRVATVIAPREAVPVTALGPRRVCPCPWICVARVVSRRARGIIRVRHVVRKKDKINSSVEMSRRTSKSAKQI